MRPFAIVEGMLVAGLAVALIVKPQPKSLKAEQQPPVPMMNSTIPFDEGLPLASCGTKRS